MQFSSMLVAASFTQREMRRFRFDKPEDSDYEAALIEFALPMSRVSSTELHEVAPDDFVDNPIENMWLRTGLSIRREVPAN